MSVSSNTTLLARILYFNVDTFLLFFQLLFWPLWSKQQLKKTKKVSTMKQSIQADRVVSVETVIAVV